jgi:cobalt/nickel transport system permease protein
MRHDFLDRFSRLESPIHHLPTAVKLVGALGLIAALITIPLTHLWFFAASAGLLCILTAVSRIPWKFILRRLILLEPFVLGIAIMALFQPGGLTVFLTVVVKSTLCLFTMILLSNTTPFAELLSTLRRVGFPRLLVTVLALLYRYIFVLIDEAERLSRARESRTFRKSQLQRWHSLASLIGQLFVRSTERAERIFAAMLARGWK